MAKNGLLRFVDLIDPSKVKKGIGPRNSETQKTQEEINNILISRLGMPPYFIAEMPLEGASGILKLRSMENGRAETKIHEKYVKPYIFQKRNLNYDSMYKFIQKIFRRN